MALETIDLAKDPYFMRNHLGSYECKLCLTLHNNEGNYLAPTRCLAKRAAREAKDAPAQPLPHKRTLNLRMSVKIGRLGYRVTKQYDPETKQRSLLFQIEYPEIEDLTKPRHRFMSSFEQRVESFDKRYQYLLFAAEPYETIGFKVPSTEIDKSTPKFFNHWDPYSKMFTLQLYFKVKNQRRINLHRLQQPMEHRLLVSHHRRHNKLRHHLRQRQWETHLGGRRRRLLQWEMDHRDLCHLGETFQLHRLLLVACRTLHLGLQSRRLHKGSRIKEFAFHHRHRHHPSN